MTRVRAQAVLATLIVWVTTAHAQWGSWIPINDGNQNRVSISFRKTHDCDGNACLYYWRFLNQYSDVVTLDCQLLITNPEGRQTKDDCAVGKLPPGQIKTNGGWWTYSSAEPRVLFKRVVTASNQSHATSGLVYSTCDPDPDAHGELCNRRKLECNRNIYAWCEFSFGKEGTAKNLANRSVYQSCVDKGLTRCESSQTSCLSRKMRRCATGQFCDPATNTCVESQHH